MLEETKRDQLFSIISAFAENYRGFVSARIVALTASSLIVASNINKDVKALVRSHPELEPLLEISPQHWDSFSKFTNEMGWVFIVAMLDTFVNDLILFMCMNYPEGFLSKQSISVAALAKKSPDQIIHEEAEKFLINAGKFGLLAKLNLVVDKTGSKDIVGDKDKRAINASLMRRNEIVHRRGARHLYPGWAPVTAEAWHAHDTELVDTAVHMAGLVWRVYVSTVIGFIGEALEPREVLLENLLNKKCGPV